MSYQEFVSILRSFFNRDNAILYYHDAKSVVLDEKVPGRLSLSHQTRILPKNTLIAKFFKSYIQLNDHPSDEPYYRIFIWFNGTTVQLKRVLKNGRVLEHSIYSTFQSMHQYYLFFASLYSIPIFLRQFIASQELYKEALIKRPKQ